MAFDLNLIEYWGCSETGPVIFMHLDKFPIKNKLFY